MGELQDWPHREKSCPCAKYSWDQLASKWTISRHISRALGKQISVEWGKKGVRRISMKKQLILQKLRLEKKKGKKMLQVWGRYFPEIYGQNHSGSDLHMQSTEDPTLQVQEVAVHGVLTLD